jgi:hypothetical protein
MVTKEEVVAVKDNSLPIYTILLPVYKEDRLIRKLIWNLRSLDYPKEKLDVKLLIEEDDDKTLNAVRNLDFPANFETIVVPFHMPKTKPKACNYGLFFCKGKYLTIYDAEDVPDADQLKKCVALFRKLPENFVVLQGALNYFNKNENILTRMFTLEYTYWFDYMLPGLLSLNVPIPLGGTSNHFKFDKLIELGVAKNITLKYNTNCTNLPKKMIDYWQHFKKISLNASVDAYGDLNRYIRYPTGWSLVETNLMKFKELSHENLILQIHITVQMYNILHLDKLLEFLDMYKMNNIHLGILDHPSCLNIKVLPTELKELARDRLKPFMHIPAVRGVVDYMLAADLSSQLTEFKIYTLALDKSRNESILELVPEMKDIFNNDI